LYEESQLVPSYGRSNLLSSQTKKDPVTTDEFNYGRSSRPFSLASPTLVWNDEECRLPTAAERAHLCLEHQSAEVGVSDFKPEFVVCVDPRVAIRYETRYAFAQYRLRYTQTIRLLEGAL